MTWLTQEGNAWNERSSPSSHGSSIHVRAEPNAPPEVRFLTERKEFFHLSGADPRQGSNTTHTVAIVDFEGTTGTRLFAVHAEANSLTFEDLRPKNSHSVTRDEFDQVQSALSEILVPVYIDDVVSDLSEERSGLVTLHTAQYQETDTSSWTYFRTSAFDAGELAFEDECGTL